MAPAAEEEEEDARSFSSYCNLLCPSFVAPFPVAVIGLGLIGSAASRYLSLALGSSLLAIGTPEPTSFSSHNGPFASHYDQGRLTRIADPDPVWAFLASRSIARYSSLQQSSGIRFHYPVGSLRVSPSHGDVGDSLLQSFHVGRKNGAVQEKITSSETLRKRFSCFQFQSGDAAIMEEGGAGYINPRSLVSAQLALAERNGACILRETVVEIIPYGDGVRIVTDKGKTLLARKALVCAGAYSSFLLPTKRALDLKTKARTVVLAEVEETEKDRLAEMPTFIWRLHGNRQLQWVYGCPPVRYPDGKVAIKIGGTAWEAAEVGGSKEQVTEWFKSGGDLAEKAALEEVLSADLMPGLRVKSVSWKPCVVSFTAHRRPYIGAVDGNRPAAAARLFVAAGGCGAAAKSSDEIGKLAAGLTLTGKWTCPLDASLFRAVFVGPEKSPP